MDEVEFLQLYNTACNAAERITAPETKTAVMHILQLISGLHTRLLELQVEEDEC